MLVACLGGTAHATGVCENTEVRYDPPELFDDKTQSFAIPASQPWCDEVHDGGAIDEVRGAVSFVELRDVNDKVIGILSTAQGNDAKHLEQARGKFEAIAIGKLHATLVARGYAPLRPSAKCKLATAWTDVAPPGGWRAATLQLDIVQRGGKRVLRRRLGEGSIERRGDQLARAHVIAGHAAIAVIAIVPSCAGPPPGYFGPDDGGDCYRVNTPVALQLDAPELAACF